MAVIIKHSLEDRSGNTDKNISTLESEMIVEADSIAEAMGSAIIPQYGSRHRHNARLLLASRNFEPVGNIGRKVQISVKLTYTDESDAATLEADANKEPWELGAQNVHVSYTTEPVPLKYGYRLNGDLKQIKNSAGRRLLVETQNTIRQISFVFCVKAKNKGEPPINDDEIINSRTETVAGYTFEPYYAKLMPMNATFVPETDENGNTTRSYWQIEAVILENKRSWQRKALNVGTMAKFDPEKPAQPIYQYTPWTSEKDEENIKIKPKFGSIDDVIAAKKAYSDKFADNEKQSRFDMLPYQEITEPLPLTKDGKVDENALIDPENNPYLVVPYFETKPASWAQWNLPKKRA